MSGARRVAKHREREASGRDVDLQELLIGLRVLPPALIRNYTPAELEAGVDRLLSMMIDAHKATLEAAPAGALQQAPLKFALVLDESDSQQEDDAE